MDELNEEQQKAALIERLTAIGHPEGEVVDDEEDIAMLYIGDSLICGVTHALTLSDDDLKALIDETIK